MTLLFKLKVEEDTTLLQYENFITHYYLSSFSTSKISAIIKTIVSSFNPSIDVDQLKLPGKSCVGYMRKNELKTISDAHKATILCQHAADKKLFKLNTDGTTKARKKLGAVAVNDLVVSVNELYDGTAVADISRELEKLRKIAHSVNIPNTDSINWTLFVSSTSDSASTQNKLIDEHREADESDLDQLHQPQLS